MLTVAVRAPVDRGELGRREAALQVRPHKTVPLVLGHIEDHPLAQNAVRADQYVESLELVERSLDHPLGGVHIGDIAHEGHGFAAGVADFLHDRLHFGGVHPEATFNVEARVGDDNLRALLAEHTAEIGADPASAAGDDADSTVQMLRRHRRPPRVVRSGPRRYGY